MRREVMLGLGAVIAGFGYGLDVARVGEVWTGPYSAGTRAGALVRSVLALVVLLVVGRAMTDGAAEGIVRPGPVAAAAAVGLVLSWGWRWWGRGGGRRSAGPDGGGGTRGGRAYGA